MFARLLNFFRKPKADSLRVQLGADSPEKAIATASVATEKPVFLGALENDQLLSHLPKDFQTRVLLENGKLLVSDELRAKPELLSFVGLARRYGINQVEFVAPTVFDDRSRRLMNISVSMSDTDVEQYAKNLFQQAYDEGASDIHLLNTGAYGIVRFRRMGLIKDHSRLTGDLADRLISAIYGTMCQSTMDGTYSPMKRQEGRVADRKWLPSGVHSMRVHTEPIECVQSPTGVGAYMPIRLLYDRTNATGSLTDRAKALGYPFAPFFSVPERVLEWTGRVNLGEQSLQTMLTLLGIAGRYFRWISIPVCAFLAGRIFFGSVVERYRFRMTASQLIRHNAQFLPCLRPIAGRDLMAEDIDAGPWRAARQALQFAVEHGLLLIRDTQKAFVAVDADRKPGTRGVVLGKNGIPRENSPSLIKPDGSFSAEHALVFNTEAALEIFERQVERRYTGRFSLPNHMTGLAAAFMAFGFGDKTTAQNLLDHMATSFQGDSEQGWTVTTADADQVFDKYIECDEIRAFCY